MDKLLTYIEIVVGVQALITSAGAIFVSWVTNKVRADNGKLREDILDRLEKKLDEYLRTSRFKDYQESHAKEHLEIQSEITRFRDWKHQVAEPMLRKHDTVLAIGKDKD